MKTYAIIKTRDGFCGQPGMRETLSTGLTLKDAQRELLRLFNIEIEKHEAVSAFKNWGLACAWDGKETTIKAFKTGPDGTRYFRYDVYEWAIIPE